MTSTGTHASDPSYSWFNIDICLPPVEEEDEDEIVRNNIKDDSTDNSQHAKDPSHSKADHVKKPSTTTSEPADSKEATIQKSAVPRMNEMKVPLSPVQYVTERPPVRLVRPKAPEKKDNPQHVPANEHSDRRYDGIFSALRNIAVPNVASSEVDALIALSIRQEQASPGAGLDLFVRTMLHWNNISSLSSEALPLWFVALSEQADDSESQKVLLSFVSKPAKNFVSGDFMSSKGTRCINDKRIYNVYQGLFLFMALLLFLITLLAAPIITLLNKIRESRRAQHSWDYTEYEEQYYDNECC